MSTNQSRFTEADRADPARLRPEGRLDIRLARVAALAGIAIGLVGAGPPPLSEGEQTVLDDPRLALWLPAEVYRARGELLGHDAVIQVGPMSRDLSPASEYVAATVGGGERVKLRADGRIAGYVAGQPFPLDAVDCAQDPDAGTKLAWDAALAWEGDGARGHFRMRHEDAGEQLPTYVEGSWYKIWLSHRVESAWLEGQGGDLFPAERRSFAYVVSVDAPFDERGFQFTEFRFEPPDGNGGHFDGGKDYTRRRCEGLALEGRHPARALLGAGLVREDFADYSAPVPHSRWRCAGERQGLAPIAHPGSGIGAKDDPERGLEDLRFELRPLVTLESVPVADGAPYARRVVVLDRQTMRPFYATTYDEKGTPLRVTLHAWAWSGDDPAGDTSWDGVAAARTLLPRRTLVVDVETGARKRIDYLGVTARPTLSVRQVRRMIVPGPFHCHSR